MIRKSNLVLIAALFLPAAGCTTAPGPTRAADASRGAPPPPVQRSSPEGVPSAVSKATEEDLRGRLDRIIDRRLDRQDAVNVLGSFRIGGYDLQDKDTFWGHRTVGGGGSPYSEYYLTYRNRYVIMLLRDRGDLHTCLDVKVMDRTSRDYEMTTGRVEVDGSVDEEVIVVFNKNWTGDSSTDIAAAFKASTETGRIEVARYRTIRIDREE